MKNKKLFFSFRKMRMKGVNLKICPYNQFLRFEKSIIFKNIDLKKKKIFNQISGKETRYHKNEATSYFIESSLVDHMQYYFK